MSKQAKVGITLIATIATIAVLAPWVWPVLAYWTVETCSEVLNRG